jgi:hypothetical protein
MTTMRSTKSTRGQAVFCFLLPPPAPIGIFCDPHSSGTYRQLYLSFLLLPFAKIYRVVLPTCIHYLYYFFRRAPNRHYQMGWGGCNNHRLEDSQAEATGAVAAMSGEWSFAAVQRTPLHGGKDFPAVRYSASAVSYQGELIVTHGYFYNHNLRHPGWQSDAWAFNFGTSSWRKVHAGERHGAPSARYSSSAVLHDHALWMFGGDDGGHKKSMFNYVFKAWFDELLRFDLKTYVWHKVEPSSETRPPKRALHGAVTIGQSMYVYGGLEVSAASRQARRCPHEHATDAAHLAARPLGPIPDPANTPAPPAPPPRPRSPPRQRPRDRRCPPPCSSLTLGSMSSARRRGAW